MVSPAVPRELSVWHNVSTGLSDHERFGFQHFQDLTGPAMQAMLPSPEWVTLAQQVSVQEPAVFQAIAATGTVARGLTVLMHPMYARPIDTELELQALRRYGNAVRMLREYVERAVVKSVSMEPILLTCLLCVCFEIFRGRNSTAAQHSRLGWQIVKDCSNLFEMEGSPSVQFFSSVFQHGADISALFHNKERHVQDCCQLEYSSFPVAFTSIEEATSHLIALTQAGEHLRNEFLELAKSHPTTRNADSSESPHAARFCLSSCLSRTIPCSMAQASRLELLQRAHGQWRRLFTKYEQALAQQVIKNHRLILHIQHFYSSFTLATCRETQETLTDCFASDFERILDLIEQYLKLVKANSSGEHPSQFHSNPFFGSSILPTLSLIAHKCRDPMQRRRALQILFTANKREGLEHSGSLGYYAQAVVALEEQRPITFTPLWTDVSEISLPPEHARFCDVVTVGAGARGVFKLICARYMHEVPGDMQVELVHHEGGTLPRRQCQVQRFAVATV